MREKGVRNSSACGKCSYNNNKWNLYSLLDSSQKITSKRIVTNSGLYNIKLRNKYE
jgi:hypothetical protein